MCRIVKSRERLPVQRDKFPDGEPFVPKRKRPPTKAASHFPVCLGSRLIPANRNDRDLPTQDRRRWRRSRLANTGSALPMFLRRQITVGVEYESCHERRWMRDYTTREKLKITAGAVASLVIVGWVVVLAIAFLSAR
jgi:hypothetical protein